MNEFILLTDAFTNKLMIIRKSMICSVEEAIKDCNAVRRLYYTDGRTTEYVKDSLLDIFNKLKETN